MTTFRFLLVFLTVPVGCREDEVNSCAPGFSLGADGRCSADEPTGDDDDDDDTGVPTGDTGTPTDGTSSTTDEPAELEDVLDTLPRCRDDGNGDGDLDLVRGCAGGVCAGDDVEVVLAVHGEPLGCESTYFESDGYRFGQLDCSWGDGIGASFGDDDFDGIPDPGRPAIALDLRAPYAGTTSDGLGLGDEVSCFVEAEDPTSVLFLVQGRDWHPTYLGFGRYAITDYADNETGAWLPDGKVDGLTIDDF